MLAAATCSRLSPYCLCLCNQELTGKLPKEYPLSSGERPPQIRRRVGTSFKLDDLFPYNEVCIQLVDRNPVTPSLVFRLSLFNLSKKKKLFIIYIYLIFWDLKDCNNQGQAL